MSDCPLVLPGVEAKRRFHRIRGHWDLKTLFSAIGRHTEGKTLDLKKRVA